MGGSVIAEPGHAVRSQAMDTDGLGALVTRTQWLAECTVPRVPQATQRATTALVPWTSGRRTTHGRVTRPHVIQHASPSDSRTKRASVVPTSSPSGTPNERGNDMPLGSDDPPRRSISGAGAPGPAVELRTPSTPTSLVVISSPPLPACLISVVLPRTPRLETRTILEPLGSLCPGAALQDNFVPADLGSSGGHHDGPRPAPRSVPGASPGDITSARLCHSRLGRCMGG
jgi:hypothetical protein